MRNHNKSKRSVKSLTASKHKNVEEALRYRVAFEKLIMDISTRFINPPPDDIDEGINHALELIGKFIGVDRSYLFLFSDHGKIMSNTHEWCAPGIEPQIQRLQGIITDDEFPWFSKIIKKLEPVYIPRVADLPEEARTEKKEFQLEGIQSLICVPMVTGASLIGFLGFDSVRGEKFWSDDIIALLKIVGEIFTNALGRRQTEKALRENEEKYRAILENIEDGYYEVDIAGNFTFFNDSLCRMLGYNRDEMMGMNNRQYTNQENSKTLYQAFNKVYKTGNPEKAFAWKVVKKDGTIRFAEASVSLIRDDRGQPNGFRGIVHDITERKQAEESLNTEKQRLKTLTENAPFGMVMIGKDGTFKYINPKFIELFGYDLEDIPNGKTWFRKAYPDPNYRHNVISTWAGDLEILSPGEKRSRTFTVTCKDGTEKIINFIPVQLETGENLMTCEDITERKHAEEALRRSEEEAKRLAQENAVMAEIGRVISSTLQIEEVYEHFAEEVRKIIQWDRIAVNIINPEKNTAIISYVVGVDVPDARPGGTYSLSDSMTERVIRTRSSIIVQTEDENELVDHFPSLLTTFQSGLLSMMSIPLISQDQVIGVLHFRSLKANAYAEMDLRLAERVGNQIAGAIANAQLFNEHKRAEERLRESEEKYRTILEDIEEGYYEIDIAGNLTFFNNSICRILGYSRDELIGMNNRQYSDQENAKKLYHTFNEVYRTRKPIKGFDWEIIRKDGMKRFGEISVSLIEDSKGQPIGFRGISRDITERKQAEEALRKSEEESKRLAQENAAMAEIGRIISSTLNLDEVYERLAEEVKKIIPFDRISISTIDFDHSTTTIVYAAGVEIADRHQGKVIPLTGTATEEGARTRSNLIINMEDKDEIAARFPGLLPTLTSGLRSLMLIPLISKDQVIGVLHLRRIKPNAYSERDLMLAKRVGNQIAGAIANAQLFIEHKLAEKALKKSEEELKRLAEENAVMAEIGRIISSSIDIEEVYDQFGKEVRKVIPFDRILINMVNPGANTFTTTYLMGINVDGRPPKSVIQWSGSATKEVFDSRSSLLIQTEDINELKDRFPALLPHFRVGLRSFIAVPLISKNTVLGALNIQSTKLYIYTERDLRLAERVGNQIVGAVANAQLFANQQRVEEALKESQETLATVFDSVDADIYIGDLENYQILFMNKHIKDSFGQDLVGKICWQAFRNESGPCPHCTNNQLLGPDGQPTGVHIWEGQNPITGRWYINYDRAIRWVDGRFVRLQVATETTELKRAEKEKGFLEEQLRHSQRMEAIGRLAGGIAHDFNNLLTIIKGYSQLSLLDLKEGDPLRGNIEEIQNASQRAADLTRQLLAFSRRQMMEMKVLDLNALLKDLNKMVRRIIGEDIDLFTMLADDLGNIKADLGQIEQLIMNLAVNARDAMPDGGKLTLVTANVELDETYAYAHVGVTPGRYVMFSITDTGVGMTPEIKERIFEPFFTTKEKGKGTGLGLSTVYGIVKQTGGEIEVFSESGRGTTFKIYLPRTDEPTVRVKLETTREELPRGNETILVVEDEEEVRKLAVRILEGQGYRMLEAANGKEALMICEKQKDPIHLILTDVVMPEMGGKELADQVKRLWPEIKILFTSGYTDDAIVHHGVLNPEIALQKKPYSPSILARKVREVLDTPQPALSPKRGGEG